MKRSSVPVWRIRSRLSAADVHRARRRRGGGQSGEWLASAEASGTVVAMEDGRAEIEAFGLRSDSLGRRQRSVTTCECGSLSIPPPDFISIIDKFSDCAWREDGIPGIARLRYGPSEPCFTPINLLSVGWVLGHSRHQLTTCVIFCKRDALL